jgi:putative colanic acid biosynthesis UDP-glucose lipid carrier transferase
VFAVRSLLFPVVTVLGLLACLLFWRRPLYGSNFLLSVLAFFLVANVFDVAPIRRESGDPHFIRSLFDIVARWLLVVAFLWAVLHLSGRDEFFRDDVMLSWVISTPLLLWLARISSYFLLARDGDGGKTGQRRAVIVGLNELGLRLEGRLQTNPQLRTQVMGYFEDRSPERLPVDGLRRVLGKPAALADYVLRNHISVVYITLPMTHSPRVLDILESLRDSTASVYFVPDMHVFGLVQARVDVIGDLPVVAVCESPFYGVHSITKRASDLLLAGLLLVACAPLLIFTAIGVRLSSPGPIILRQRRYGLDGREILVRKFRSMTVVEDGAAQYTQVTRNDARVTPFGAFIRRTSLDELPQLLNVLEGSLSLVGPRPHVVAVNETYRKQIRGYMMRHKVKPGITGWAQINGHRGGDDLESMSRRVEFDLDYLRNWSLLLDFSILLRTAAVVWSDRRAY